MARKPREANNEDAGKSVVKRAPQKRIFQFIIDRQALNEGSTDPNAIIVGVYTSAVKLLEFMDSSEYNNQRHMRIKYELLPRAAKEGADSDDDDDDDDSSQEDEE
jgi:hypothetical protein